MQKSPIQWTDATWNPLLGCRRFSTGCEHCYAERLIAVRLSHNPRLPMYHDIARVTAKGEPQFTGARRLLLDRLDEPLRARKGRKIFVCDMGDLFFEGHPFEDIAAVFGVMAAAQQHTFQVLTKRPHRALEFYAWLDALIDRSSDNSPFIPEICGAAANSRGANVNELDLSDRWPLPNVWIGASVEDQAAANRRIPELLSIPAAVRFLSCEPLLEKVLLDNDVTSWLTCHGEAAEECCASVTETGKHFHGVDWVIVGGESGPKARPFDLAWARSLLDQCRAAGVPFFMKQIGAKAVEHLGGFGLTERWTRDKHGGDPAEWPEDLRVREFQRVS